jgi:DNA-binding MarR family transcriptional regulator
LTPKGKTAVANHKDAHEKYDVLISDILAGANVSQRQFLEDFLQRLEQKLKQN